PYYPFSGWKEWKVASWLLCSGLSMGKINSFLSLEMVSAQSFSLAKSDRVPIYIKDLSLLFSSAKELQGRAEMFPSSPHWMLQVIPTSHLTELPIILYWHDPLDCILSILNHPMLHKELDFAPHRVYTTVQWLCHVYSE
ncbi:uncharacterized protein BJ212DRAFT_1260894, partial [Suillus subaureus]